MNCKTNTTGALHAKSQQPGGAERAFSSYVQARIGLMLLLGFTVFCVGGATCTRRSTIPEFAPPVVFESPPELADIIQQVNRSLAIQRLESNTLKITSPDIAVRLSGVLKWERPHNFELVAYPFSRVAGTALAAGSNSEEFWLQTQTPSPPTLYFAKHDEFENQTGPRRILPVSPLWLREALGVVELDPSQPHEGPFTQPDGTIEIRSYIHSPRGYYKRQLIIDAETATIQRTVLSNQDGKMVAVAQLSDHQYYSAIDYSLPHHVDIQLQPDQGPPMAFSLEVGLYMLNQPATSQQEFQMPDRTGISTVNLLDANRAMGEISRRPPEYSRSARATTPFSPYQTR